VTPSVGSAPSVVMSGVRKHFGRTVALDGAQLQLFGGEVHALLGENGAGKTTLMGILAGLLPPDEADIRIRDRSLVPSSPREAWDAGIGMVHQHFKLVGRLSVLENLALGVRRAAGGLGLPHEHIRSRVSELMEETGLRVPLESPLDDLPVGARQRVEILKLLIRDPDVLILDEPTAVLAPQEVDRLLELLRRFAERGKTVVLIAHKLDEVLRVADRVTVLREGCTVLRAARSELDESRLVRAMIGGDVVPARRIAESSPGATVLRLEGVTAPGPRGEAALRGVDLSVSRGEIVAVAGVDGNGQRELAAVLAGRLRPDGGSVDLPEAVGFIPEDRGREALIPEFTLTENVALSGTERRAFRRGPWIRWDDVRARTRDLIERFDVRTTGASARASSLSGGNQQKLVVARELEHASDLLVAQNPARGLDVAAEEFVHRSLLRLRESAPDGGDPPGIVLISTDLDEVLALADRVLVMVRGRLVDPGDTLDRERIGAVMVSGEVVE